jgi:transposase
VDVVALSKTPRASCDRIKHDRKDAELLSRLLLAGSLTTVWVPSPELEASRELARAREQLRDLDADALALAARPALRAGGERARP